MRLSRAFASAGKQSQKTIMINHKLEQALIYANIAGQACQRTVGAPSAWSANQTDLISDSLQSSAITAKLVLLIRKNRSRSSLAAQLDSALSGRVSEQFEAMLNFCLLNILFSM